MSLKYIKLVNGDDLLSFVLEYDSYIVLIGPINIFVDPMVGYAAKNWITMSEDQKVEIDKKNILFSTAPSATAIKYYNDYMKQVYNVPSDPLEDLDTINSIKH